jgi:hypothetical protein
VNHISCVVDCWFAEPVVETESARHQVQQASGKRFRDVSDSLFDRDARGAEQAFDTGGDAHPRVFDQLEGFVEDALDQRLVEEFEFGSHVVPTGAKARSI